MGVSQRFLTAEVIVECSLGDSSGGQDGVEACTLETRFVDLTECRLQEEFSACAPDHVTSLFFFRVLANKHTD